MYISLEGDHFDKDMSTTPLGIPPATFKKVATLYELSHHRSSWIVFLSFCPPLERKKHFLSPTFNALGRL